jgi:hypothetical protein
VGGVEVEELRKRPQSVRLDLRTDMEPIKPFDSRQFDTPSTKRVTVEVVEPDGATWTLCTKMDPEATLVRRGD